MQDSVLYLLKVCPLFGIRDVFQCLYGHKLGLIHAWQVQVTLVDLSKITLAQLLHEAHC